MLASLDTRHPNTAWPERAFALPKTTPKDVDPPPPMAVAFAMDAQVQSVWRGHHVRTGGRGKKVKDKVGKQGKGGKAGKKGTGGKGAKKAKGNTKSHSATAKLKQNPKQKPVKTNKVTVKKNASKT